MRVIPSHGKSYRETSRILYNCPPPINIKMTSEFTLALSFIIQSITITGFYPAVDAVDFQSTCDFIINARDLYRMFFRTEESWWAIRVYFINQDNADVFRYCFLTTRRHYRLDAVKCTIIRDIECSIVNGADGVFVGLCTPEIQSFEIIYPYLEYSAHVLANLNLSNIKYTS